LRVTLPFITRAPDGHGVIDTRPARSGVEEELVAPADDDAHTIIIYVPVARVHNIIYYYYYIRESITLSCASLQRCYIYMCVCVCVLIYTLIYTHTRTHMWTLYYIRTGYTSYPCCLYLILLLYGMYRRTIRYRTHI